MVQCSIITTSTGPTAPPTLTHTSCQALHHYSFSNWMAKATGSLTRATENGKHICKKREADHATAPLEGLLLGCRVHVLLIHHCKQLPLLSCTPWLTFLVPFVFSAAFYFNHEEEEIFMPASRTIKTQTGALILHRTRNKHRSFQQAL